MTVVWLLQYNDEVTWLLQYNNEVTWQRCDCCSTMRKSHDCCSTIMKSHDSNVTAAVQWGSHMTVTQPPQDTKCWCHASTQSCGHLHVGWWGAAASSRPSQIRHPVCCCKHSGQNEKAMWHKHKTRVISTWLYKCICSLDSLNKQNVEKQKKKETKKRKKQ